MIIVGYKTIYVFLANSFRFLVLFDSCSPHSSKWKLNFSTRLGGRVYLLSMLQGQRALGQGSLLDIKLFMCKNLIA